MITIKREKTAIARNKHSKPYNYIIKKEMIKPEMMVLDYGCGKGYDVDELASKGFNIQGFDPYQEGRNNWDIVANGGKCFDLVTCNYVFNVIENDVERYHVLELLKGITRNLIISVRADKKAIKENWRKYKDGYITTAGTFQKFYDVVEVNSFFNTEPDKWEIKVLSANSNEIMVQLVNKYLI